MSLLQDALRRAQRLGGASSQPSFPPLRGESAGKAKTRRRMVAGVLAAAFVVGVAGVLMLTYRAAPPPVAPVPAASQRIPTPAPPAAPLQASAVPALPEASSVQHPAKGTSTSVPNRPPSKTGLSRVRLPGATVPPRASGTSAPAPELPATIEATPPAAAAERIDPVLEKFNGGVAALNRGDSEEAVRLLRGVTAASPGLVEGWNALGLALLRQRRLDEADAAFSKVLSLSPRYPSGLLNAGLLRLEQGRVEEGSAFFSRAADLSPGALAPRVNLAVAQARLGRLGEAEETLRSAGRRFPGNPDVLYHLGTVYDRMGNRGKATEAYSAFLAASAGSRSALEDRVRERLRAWGVPSAK